MNRFTRVALCLGWACCWCGATLAADWPQFRGQNSSGLASADDKLPTQIGPTTNVLWKVPFPSGHSSPVIVGDRIYLTAAREEQLVTIALDRHSGKIVWEVEAPHEKLEKVHGIGSYAQPSPAADASCVVSFFGSSGLHCYDHAGKLLWKRAMGPFNNDFGAGSSPVIVGDRVILCQDHDTESFLAAFDKKSGKTIWHTDRSEFPRNYCSPVIWEVQGKKQIVIAATLRVVGYDFETGSELWTVRGIARSVCMTPVVSEEGNLYVAGWAAGGDEGERITVEPWDKVAPQVDANKNSLIEYEELPAGPIRMRYNQVDRDKSGGITQMEYEYFRGLFDLSRNVLIGIKPGASGDATSSHVMWEYAKFVPFCASPLAYRGLVFTIKDGGIVSCLDARTGKAFKQGRIEATGDYYSSPVAGDGKIYTINETGQLSVISAEKDWQVLHTASFAEDAYATPAISNGRLYFRTAGNLYCFGVK